MVAYVHLNYIPSSIKHFQCEKQLCKSFYLDFSIEFKNK